MNDYAIYSKTIDGVQTVKSALSGEIIGVLVYSLTGELSKYFESWNEYILSVWGFQNAN